VPQAGIVPDGAALPFLAHPVSKTFRLGTHRTVAPAETLARVRPFARAMGITRIGNVTGLDYLGIPVAIAVRPNSRSVAVSAGKGLRVEQAMASALMEAAEAFHGEELASRYRHASWHELAAEADVADPMRLSGTGTSFDAKAAIPWIEGFDLLEDSPCWVPAEIVHTDCTLPALPGSGYFLMGSNGLASGNHMLEALIAGICEVIERDAVALWHARGLRERIGVRLDLATVDDLACRELLDTYAAAGITPRVWNVTSDIGVAAFLCDVPALPESAVPGMRRARGAGCHPDRGVALARALMEAAQSRLNLIAGVRDDIRRADYVQSDAERVGAALLDVTLQDVPLCPFFAGPDFAGDDLAADLRALLARLRAAGIGQVVAVDLTRSDLGIPMVRVVIPGLEWDGNHPGYRPGLRARAARAAS
jgi:ribosomal protein S12 methylthiotransferase accessory factor